MMNTSRTRVATPNRLRVVGASRMNRPKEPIPRRPNLSGKPIQLLLFDSRVRISHFVATAMDSPTTSLQLRLHTSECRICSIRRLISEVWPNKTFHADLVIPSLTKASASINFPRTPLLGFCTIEARFLQHDGFRSLRCRLMRRVYGKPFYACHIAHPCRD